jgi:hypothetical protein
MMEEDFSYICKYYSLQHSIVGYYFHMKFCDHRINVLSIHKTKEDNILDFENRSCSCTSLSDAISKCL